jgi:hypothetical protein
VKKNKREEVEERARLTVELEKIKKTQLSVEDGVKCAVCSASIVSAIDRHFCEVCESTMHEECRILHEENCVRVEISFQKVIKKSMNKSKK